ncbi:MAG: hypothetical protein ACYCS8_12235 [Acidithiobacillus sp.]
MFELIFTLIRRHILITLLLPVAIALTGAALHRRDLDDDFAVNHIAALMHTTGDNGTGQVQSFGQLAAGLTSTIRAVTP